MRNLYEVYERMHFYHWQETDIARLIQEINRYDDLHEFERHPRLGWEGPFIITLYLLVSSYFNSDKSAIIKFLEFLLENEHTREVPE